MAKASMPTARETAHRRAVVLRNMCDLMKSIGREGFDNPDDWMDSILERPRAKAPPPPATRRQR
jgi:hypothetical protein